jgi:hypothetical protein
MTCTGRTGKFCACASAAASAPKTAKANAALSQNRLLMAMLFSCCFGPSAARTQQIAGRLPAGHALTKELGAVAPARHAAYIAVTFQSSLMTLSGFARTGGRSTEEIYQWRPRP